MGRHKRDRRDKIMQTFEATTALKRRLEHMANERNMTVSALIRELLELAIEERIIRNGKY